MELGEVKKMLQSQSGLLGLSGGVSNDLRDIMEAADNGNEDCQNALKAYAYGIKKYIGSYAAAMGGGSVNPYTGAFNFSVREGYMIRNGKICEPIRGASLIGTGSEVLHKIDMVGQNLDTAQGMCGSSSGSVPTDVGQPLIRVSDITVGGQA